MNIRAALLVSLVCIGMTTGCRGTLYRQTGKIMSSYAVEHMVPELMSDDDVFVTLRKHAKSTNSSPKRLLCVIGQF